MKKLTTLVFLGLLYTCAKAQSDVKFKIRYLPNHVYLVSSNMTMNFSADLSGAKKIADKLAKQGITQPMNISVHYNSSGNITTGSLSAGKTPLSIVFDTPAITGTINGKPIPVPGNQGSLNMYGEVNADGSLSVDSLNKTKLPDSAAKAMEGKLNSILQLVNFPEQQLKIGDVFTQKVPFNLPGLGKGLNINIAITYKLTQIEGGKAFFDLSQSLDIETNLDKIHLNVTGSGPGKMLYDIRNSFPLTRNGELGMKFNIKTDSLSMGGTAQISSATSYTIK